jgi:hypothetical protein
MDADHDGVAEIAPLRERSFAIGPRHEICFDMIHRKKIAGLKVIVNRKPALP